MRETNDLSTRQWNLYNLLKEVTENYGEWVTNEMILANVDGYKPLEEGVNNANQKAFAEIRRDIKKLRESSILQKMIVSSRHGYKLAESKEEFEMWRAKQWRKIVGMIERVNIQSQRAKLDGQIRIVEDGSKAREVHESYVRGN